LVIEACGYV